MEAVQSKDVADKGAEGVFLTSCAEIRNRAFVSLEASLSKTAAEQSRDRSSPANARTTRSQSLLPNEMSHFCSKLNRQTPEVETTLSPRKQRTANCSNRQKIKFCESRNSSVVLAQNPPVSNRELSELEIPQRAENKHRPTVLIENFEPNHYSNFRAFVAAAFLPRGMRGRRAQFPRQSSEQAGQS